MNSTYLVLSKGMVMIGTVFNLTESRNVEFKKGGSVHSQQALKEVCRNLQ